MHTFCKPSPLRTHGYALRAAEERISEPSVLSVPTPEHIDTADERAVGPFDSKERQIAACIQIFAYRLRPAGCRPPQYDLSGYCDRVKNNIPSQTYLTMKPDSLQRSLKELI